MVGPVLRLPGGQRRGMVLAFGYLTTGLPVLLVVTRIGFLAVQRSDRQERRGQPKRGDEEDLAGMPVLQPIGIRTRNRSRPARVVVGLHDAREREVAEHRESALPKNDSRIVVPRGF